MLDLHFFLKLVFCHSQYSSFVLSTQNPYPTDGFLMGMNRDFVSVLIFEGITPILITIVDGD